MFNDHSRTKRNCSNITVRLHSATWAECRYYSKAKSFDRPCRCRAEYSRALNTNGPQFFFFLDIYSFHASRSACQLFIFLDKLWGDKFPYKISELLHISLQNLWTTSHPKRFQMKWLKTSYQSQIFKGFVHAVQNDFIILQHTTTPSINLQCWPPRIVLTASVQRSHECIKGHYKFKIPMSRAEILI
jgi:hypothetical protein